MYMYIYINIYIYVYVLYSAIDATELEKSIPFQKLKKKE